MEIKSIGANTFTFMVGEEPIDEDEEPPTLEIFFDGKNSRSVQCLTEYPST